MKRLVLTLSLLPGLALAQAQTPGKIVPTVYTLAAATATPLPMLSGTAGYAICNYDTDVIYYGTSAAVNATTHKGAQILAGKCFYPTVTYSGSDGTTNGGTVNYVFSTAGTGSGAVSYQGAR